MDTRKFRVMILTHGGANRLLELLSRNENVEIIGLFVERTRETNRPIREKIRRSVKYDGVAKTFQKFAAKILDSRSKGDKEFQAALNRKGELEKLASSLGIPLFLVSNYHDSDTLEHMKSLQPDLGILYGTNIIKESVFSIPKSGTINLHQGLCPFYRGGPAVFWELYNGEKEVGITTHFVEAKVDTGDIILQRTVPLDYDFSKYGRDFEQFLYDFRNSLLEPSAHMLTESVELVRKGIEQRVPQDITVGKRYRLPTKKQKSELVRILFDRHHGR